VLFAKAKLKKQFVVILQGYVWVASPVRFKTSN